MNTHFRLAAANLVTPGRGPRFGLMARRSSLAALVLFIMAAMMPINRIPIPGADHVMPAVALASILLLPFAIRHFRFTPIGFAVLVFVGYTLIHSILMLAIDAGSVSDITLRTTDWLRQVIAILLGFAVFLFMRNALGAISGRLIVQVVVLAAIPVLLLSFLQIVAWAFHESWSFTATQVVQGSWLRWTVIPNRVSGLSTEPALMGIYLASFALPSALVWTVYARSKFVPIIMLSMLAIALIWTFSGTTYILGLALAVGAMIWVPNRRLLIALVCALSLIGLFLFQLVPSNYYSFVLREYRSATSESPSLTVQTKAGSTLDPLHHLFDSRVLIGYGLGATSSHGEEFLSPETIEQLQLIDRYPSLKTLFGRLLAETGAIGLGLFVFLVYLAMSTARRSRDLSSERQDPDECNLASQIGLVVVAIATTVSYGSFALPFFWFWLGVIDSRVLRRRTRSAFPLGESAPSRAVGRVLVPEAQ